MLFFNENLTLYKLFAYFLCVNGHFWLCCAVPFTVWHVKATSNCIFTQNAENVSKNNYFEAPCGLKDLFYLK